MKKHRKPRKQKELTTAQAREWFDRFHSNRNIMSEWAERFIEMLLAKIEVAEAFKPETEQK